MKLSNDEKQKCLYAAILRFSTDGQSLREKTLDYLVLAGLEGTADGQGIKTGVLKRTIGNGLGTEGSKIELIQESVDRLEQRGLVEKTRIDYKPSARLTSAGNRSLEQLSSESNGLISRAIDKLLVDYDADLSIEEAKMVIKRFIINCFVDYGHNIALSILGKTRETDVTNVIDFDRAFEKSTRSLSINLQDRIFLEHRCYHFLKGHEKVFIDLKFLLTQVFYIGKILELDKRNQSRTPTL
ncbi:hypothetical protein F6455_06880 [Proteobacteria bacterium 005FR1]|nr:hypothetical protein [Proteobacteria bacterium 005FR1]